MTTPDTQAKLIAEGITLQARQIASCLSYNADKHQAAAKHMLHELAHRLDTQDIRVHKKRDGFLLQNGIGKSRLMSLKESVLYRLCGVVPREV